MSERAIRVENLSKRYRLWQKRERYKTLRDIVADGLTRPFRAVRSLVGGGAETPDESETLWALRDLSFEVRSGEVVGIIGRNGAGKSTLLKVLSRITEPTTGSVEIHGRVGSLLEVGTGFHPELTGGENIYLNGVILGMRRREIEQKFDEIVAFAQVEKFVETPVKHYSSGMYLRLAFAVAAHLEPEILLVDEVLAVGDAAFQRKCLDKMEEVGQRGRTVLFISHNMPAITRLCERSILLNNGTVISDGPSHEVVGAYLRSGLGTTASREWGEGERAPGNRIVRLRAVRVRSDDGEIREAIDIRKPVDIELEYEVREPGWVLCPIFDLYNEEGTCIFGSIDQTEWRNRPRPLGRYVSSARIPGNFLSEGTVVVNVSMRTLQPQYRHFKEQHAVAFQVVDSLAGDSARGDYAGAFDGAVRPLLDWTTSMEEKHGASVG